MLVWGKSSFHEPDVESSSESVVLKNRSIKKAALGSQSSCVLFDDGSISTFGKISEYGEHDHNQKDSFFKDSLFLDLFGGSKHTFALDRERKLYGWGCNDKRQLGVESENKLAVPKLVPLSLTKKVVQVACGEAHSLMLTIDGSMYTMGDNTYNQLGVGTLPTDCVTEPICVDSLTGVPVTRIAAGGWHSFCVTSSGRLFSWGRNDYGQLGVGDNINYKFPKLMNSLNHTVAFVAAGLDHSVILTKKGEVLTFGLGSNGQLGHNDSNRNESRPKIVEELRGSIVTQIACGYNHTVVFVPGCCHVFVFGDNTDGQLGIDKDLKKMITNPEIVKLPEFCHQFNSVASSNGDFGGVLELFACNNQTVISLTKKAKSLDFHYIESNRCIATLDKAFTDKILRLSGGETDVDVVEQLRCVMTSQSCLNGCFQVHDQMITKDNPGIDLTVAKSVFGSICSPNLRDVIVKCLSESLLPRLASKPPDIEALKVYISLPFLLELFSEPENVKKLYFPFVKNILGLVSNASKILKRWYKFIGSDFGRIVKLCCIGISVVFDETLPVDLESEPMENMLQFIQKLHELNAREKIVSYRDFYLSCNIGVDFLWRQYVLWKSQLEKEPIFVSHNFLFNAKVKSLLFHVSAKYKKTVIAARVNELNFLNMMGLNFNDYQLPITEIVVDRKNLVEDAICQLEGVDNFQTLFQVRFKGEAGIDDGALTKEFFMLVLKEILDPNYGLFISKEESNLLWFSTGDHGFESIYNLVGVLCGLALHNDAIINVNFPLAMYKKLLSKKLDLEDMKELDPVVGSSLQQLLDFKEEGDHTVEKVFFEFFTSSNGEPLKSDGENIAVTSENRGEYVQLYINYVFNDSVEGQYGSFRKGFQKVCKGELLDLFHPEELRDVVAGQQDFDWKEVEDRMMKGSEKLTPVEYKVLSWLWEVVHSLTEEEKEEFLLFLTGSSNVPITGLSMIVEFRQEDDDFLPVAVTCYNTLQLHLYSSKEILEERLKLSIKCKGFHIA